MASMANAQGQRPKAGGGGGGNKFANSLPAKFKGLTTDQAREVGLLSELAVAWVGDLREGPGLDPVVDLFGPFGGQRPEVDDDDVPPGTTPPPPPEENERGLVVLSGLGRDQYTAILELCKSQKEPLDNYLAARAKLVAKLRQLRGRETKETAAEARTHEKETVELGKEMGEAEAKLAVSQAWAFIQFEAKLSADQKNYLRMLRENPKAFKLDSPAVIQTRELLATLQEPSAVQAEDMAAKMTSFLSGNAEQNAARRPHRAGTLLGKTSQKFPELTSQYLETLNPAQQDRLIQLLAAERPYTSDYVKKRLEFLAALDSLKKISTLNDKKFILAGSQMGELEARIGLAQARVFEQLRLSLSQSQLFFITQNLVPAPAKQ
ncbi:hypothetical protein [Anatilimnocola floriformis]|uniref:hypothetical protein n=1 Tax=Anatilimnocola floriformis TaxID=2948575 RepID=UPI0020C2DF82|nr:hypothetical protein [Anatilimnocola floriformis]